MKLVITETENQNTKGSPLSVLKKFGVKYKTFWQGAGLMCQFSLDAVSNDKQIDEVEFLKALLKTIS